MSTEYEVQIRSTGFGNNGFSGVHAKCRNKLQSGFFYQQQVCKVTIMRQTKTVADIIVIAISSSH